MNSEHERHEVRRLLPWLLNGTLAEGDRERVREVLARHPDLQAEYRWLQELRQQIKSGAGQCDFDAESTLATLKARLAGEREGKIHTLPSRRFRSDWRPIALALAASLIVVQFAVIAHLAWKAPEPTEYRALSGPQRAAGNLIQVVFKENCTEAQLRAALRSVSGEVVAGPGTLGVYTVRVPAGTQASAAARLRTEPQVESATPLDSR